MKKEAVVIHSGGMDSSLCLALAVREFGVQNVISLTFSYKQRHSQEVRSAAHICKIWGVDHRIIPVNFYDLLTSNALINKEIPIEWSENDVPNTLVVGRNGLMARLGAIIASTLGAHYLYMGIIQVEASNSGYRDCSRAYMDLKQQILRIDLDDPHFEIRTPVVEMTKKETLVLANQMGILPFLLENTLSCYEGIPKAGCRKCPSCTLRNEGIRQFLLEYPNFLLPYRI